jgi:DNA-directed RNA polymerase specialized sigma24 family protein
MLQSAIQLQYTNLFHQHKNLIYKIFNNYLKDQQWHDDLLQEVALKGWEQYAKAAIDNFAAWISTIARRTVIDKLRRLKAEANRLSKCNWWYEWEPYKEYKLPVLSTLSAIESRTLQYRIEGLSFKEISELMGEPESRLRVRMHRLKEVLAKSIKHEQAQD